MATIGLQRPNQALEAIDAKDFTYYVYLIDGTVQEVAPATELRLTDEEVVFCLCDLVVARIPRKEVYFATRCAIAPPVMF
jgi:hypothetical protein